MFQKNEGEWEFTLDENDDGLAILLEVQLGKYMDTTLVKARATRNVTRAQ